MALIKGIIKLVFVPFYRKTGRGHRRVTSDGSVRKLIRPEDVQ
jgi:hypothetical protein